MRGMKLVGLSLLLVAGAASAQVSSTVTATSDYDFRAISLSGSDPALQASIDWAHESGFYLGAWASNIDYGDGVDGDVELDLYLGFAGGAEDGMGWDAGLVYYTYPGSDDINDYPEIYAGVTFGPFELKQWYTNDYVGADVDSYYTEGNLSVELPAAFTLNLHAGYNYGDAFEDSEYIDYSVGVGYTAGNFDFNLRYIDTNLDENDSFFTDEDVFNTDGRLILSVATTFPWGNE